MSLVSVIQLNDSEIKRLAEGPIAWAASKQDSLMNIDNFVNSFKAQVEECGFTVEVKVLETNVQGGYAFEAEINGRTNHSFFDPDRQVHEVVTNLLQLPGEDKGWIKSKDDAQRLLNHEAPKNVGKHLNH